MNLTTLLNRCSYALWDVNFNSWDKATLWEWIQEALYELGNRTRILKSTSYITVVVDQSEYDLPSDFVDTVRLSYGEGDIPLFNMTGRQRDFLGALSTESGFPTQFSVDESGFSKFKIWPVPDASVITEPKKKADAEDGMLGSNTDTFTLDGLYTFKSRDIIYNEEDSTYYRYLGDVELGNPYTAPPRTGSDVTVTFIDGSGTPSTNEIEGLDHDDASTVWEEALTKLNLTYYRTPTIPTVTDITSTTETDAITLDTGIPEQLWQKFYLVVCHLVLRSADEPADQQKSMIFEQRAQIEFWGKIRKAQWRASRPKKLFPL